MTKRYRSTRRPVRALVLLAGVAALAAPAPAVANDGPANPAQKAVDAFLGLGGFFSDLSGLEPGNDVPATGGPEKLGQMQPPIVEPTIDGVPTTEKCLADQNGFKVCKPAAGTLNILPDGRIFYWNALEGTENNQFSIVSEGGTTFTNDATRVLDLANRDWLRPEPLRGGANPDGADPVQSDPLIPGLQSKEKYNDGALFGSHQTYLADGRVLVQGGADYSADPGVPGTRFGVVELGGLKATRIYDPVKNVFTQVADTQHGRWYPTLVPLANGKVLNASGVRKLIKPLYADKAIDSGTNVLQTETFDPKSSRWTGNGKKGERSLPLYPRLHLLPDGKVFYNSAGQSFNPVGQSYDQPTWNAPAMYDPKNRTWSQPEGASLGQKLTNYRGSTYSTMLALKPDADGGYDKARFLTGGGVLGFVGATSPGSYFPTRSSKITSVDTSGGRDRVSITKTGPLNQPRWFGSGTLLPTGEVLVTSGADKDEVVGPGTERAVMQAELFDPETNRYRPVARQQQPRTYHNTAALLPDGTVLIGGHAPISTLYLNNTTLPGGFAPHDGRDPSFEVYKPPYLFRGAQPKIRKARATITPGKTFGIRTDVASDQIESVMLMRFTSTTHLVDGGQRGVELPIRARKDKRLIMAGSPNSNVIPPGPYMLFVNRKSDQGPIPSQARSVTVKGG